MGNLVRLPRPAYLRVVPSTRTHFFGQILAEIDRIPVSISSILDQASAADLALIANHLDHCARRVRVLAECCTGGRP